jgi:2-polyprenyl-3-methyl-5-hydroxy-6-metoxy-1,4-benzoquinol methylase
MTSVDQYYQQYWQDKLADLPPAHRAWDAARRHHLQQALAALPKGAQVLDAGCGSGAYAEFMTALGFSVTATDIAFQPLVAARTTQPAVQFAKSAVEHLPYRSSSFDALWTTEVVEHLLDTEAAFREFGRVLKPGGLLILTTPYHGLIKNLVVTLLAFDHHFDPVGPHIRFFSTAALTRLAAQNGMTVRKAIGIGRRWPLYMSHFLVAQKQ